MIRPMFMEEAMPTHWVSAHNINSCMVTPSSWLPSIKNTAADEQGNDRRDGIYLPKGNWVDYFTGDLYAGGRIINHFDAPLWKLPVLVKADAIIPMANPNNTPAEIKKDLRIFEIYAERGTKAGLYDDDGKTQAYLEGKRAFTELKTTVKNRCSRSTSTAPWLNSPSLSNHNKPNCASMCLRLLRNSLPRWVMLR